MQPGIPTFGQALSDSVGQQTIYRVAKVTSISSGTISIAISDSVLVDATYILRPELPHVGDLVLAIRQGSQWVIVGELSSDRRNAVLNSSFEDHDASGNLLNWTSYIPAGQSIDMTTGSAELTGAALDGAWRAYISAGSINDASNNATADAYWISDPFQVEEDQTWVLSGWVSGSSSIGYPFVEMFGQLIMHVYATAAETFPTGTSLGNMPTLFLSVSDDKVWKKTIDIYSGLDDLFKIPAGGKYARVLLHCQAMRVNDSFLPGALGASTPVYLYFDRIKAVRIDR